MNTDNESDDDSELLRTLSQLHNTITPTHSFEEHNQVESYSSHVNQDKISPDFSLENIITNGNETELLKKKNQHSSHIISSSPYVPDTIKKSDEEQKEKTENKNVIFYKNHNGADDKQKEKYERKKQEKEIKKPTTFFSLTSTTSPILLNNDSHSPIVLTDPDTSSSSCNLLLSSAHRNESSSLFTNQLITDDLQISNTQVNMDNSSNDNLNQQTTTDLFDPFAPTIKTAMFDDVFVDKRDADVKEFGMRSNFIPSNSSSPPPLANYNFDDLWNQSISHMDSSNNDIDPNALTWDALLNTQENTNPMSNLTWNSLFDEDKEEDRNDLKNYLNWIIDHLDNPEPMIEFTSTQNLESIIKDIHMCAMPFEPIPSPPLHVDHTVANPMINAIHHELFPIDELEQPNLTQGQASMILYEEDEEEEEEKESFDDQVKPIVEKIVTNILQLALTQVNDSYHQIEHFVDQILAQAIFEIYDEDANIPELETNEFIPTENLASIITWHGQTNKEVLDPFDQKFDSVWSSHFQAPDDTTHENLFENKTDVDPWLPTTTATTENKKDGDHMLFFSKNLEDSDLFSSTSNLTNKITEVEDDESTTLSEYMPPTLLTNPANTTTATNNLMKYTLTAPVLDDSGDDSSILDDYLSSRKVINFF
jgi:hypothetical protein